MRFVRIDLLKLSVPFRERFRHGRAERTSADCIVLVAETDTGFTGFGEIVPRPYVTGETLERVWDTTGPQCAEAWLGRDLADHRDAVEALRDDLQHDRFGIAVTGGVDLALHQVAELERGAAYTQVLGPPRSTATTRSITLGLEVPTADIARRIGAARLAGATVVKLKVTLARDADRVRHARQAAPLLQIRLDANGVMSMEEVVALGEACRDLNIHSIEQPFDRDADDLEARLLEASRTSGFAIMADESVCSIADARRWCAGSAYQYVNVRVGKHGGLVGSAAVRDIVRAAGIGMVSGTMVGETHVLRHASAEWLKHTPEIDYVEGLEQGNRLLTAEPVRPVHAPNRMFELAPDDELEQYLVSRRAFA